MRSSRSVRRFVALLIASPAILAATTVGQGSPRVLDKPQVELAEPFTNVGTVRELRDGRVLVVDNGDRALYVVDFSAGTSSQIGRPGSGPGEYRAPGILLPMAADTTFLTDAGNNRLLVIGPDAKPVATLTESWPMLDGQRGTRLPRAVDSRGRGYYIGSPVRVPETDRPIIQVDSVALYRTPRGATAVDSLAFIHLAPRKITTTSKDGKLTGVSVMTPPFPAQDAWQVFADGAVGIVRVRDYRVDWVLPDGRRVAGRPIPFEPVKVTELDKQRLMSVMRGARGRDGGGGGVGPSLPELDWPEVKPPFSFSATLAGVDGRLWVQRYSPASDSRTRYDIIDRQGIVVARVDVPNAGRIVGFGAKSIYVVRKDEDDLQYLQRFPL
jgi:hypothetical protein